jgi:hypothetical protein
MLNHKLSYLVPQPNFEGSAVLWAICEDGIRGNE